MWKPIREGGNGKKGRSCGRLIRQKESKNSERKKHNLSILKRGGGDKGLQGADANILREIKNLAATKLGKSRGGKTGCLKRQREVWV